MKIVSVLPDGGEAFKATLTSAASKTTAIKRIAWELGSLRVGDRAAACLVGRLFNLLLTEAKKAVNKYWKI